MRGTCLCGAVKFEITDTLPNIYQCHCSLCRKSTGAFANAALIVPGNQFQWVSGQGCINSYENESGYRSDFCAKCGSPLPNSLKGKTDYWVPVGLLEDKANLEVAAHLHVGSKASWEVIATGGVHYQDAPDLDCLYQLLRKNLDA
ncbi:MAG TPA: GFA family protein [Thiobacillus sp.]|nr:MAG: aldehyde-activating protein [Hydrogenophilales bacterium 28-61-11]OYZ57440.1 MAG: aldehyde-activating protein [Hydrogenophilales bacterium 16-61-112]OZA50139.1 MAG: aldehyde-activating protein [Hydrogenophilales bacterium 17-61-76]HQT68893.1 GFA family protein [Thiobacillus sp.]